jgi:hypothetical protein
MPRFWDRHWASVSMESPVRLATSSGFSNSFRLEFAIRVFSELQPIRRRESHLFFDLFWSLICCAGQRLKQDNRRKDCRQDEYRPYNRDPHGFSSQGTIAPQSFCGHRKPLKLPSKGLVLTNLRSIQN